MNTQTNAIETPQSDSKRDALRARIEASERRIAERTFADDAREAAQAATDYARAHPAKVVAGALVIGLLIGLMTAPGRRMAATAASRVTAGAIKAPKPEQSKFVTLLNSVFLTQGMKLLDELFERADAGRETLDEFSDKATVEAKRFGREAADLSGKAASQAQRIGRDAAETSGDLARRTRERAESAARSIADRVRG